MKLHFLTGSGLPLLTPYPPPLLTAHSSSRARRDEVRKQSPGRGGVLRLKDQVWEMRQCFRWPSPMDWGGGGFQISGIFRISPNVHCGYKQSNKYLRDFAEGRAGVTGTHWSRLNSKSNPLTHLQSFPACRGCPNSMAHDSHHSDLCFALTSSDPPSLIHLQVPSPGNPG